MVSVMIWPKWSFARILELYELGYQDKKSECLLIAEVYNPNEYRNYINLGKMDYLYDKVAFYDRIERNRSREKQY